MKNVLSPIAYPTSEEEAWRWGFDMFPPISTAHAWVEDWEAAAPGFNVDETRAREVLARRHDTDLNSLSVDDLFAAQSLFTKELWHTTMSATAAEMGEQETRGVATALGHSLGLRTWELAQAKFGVRAPLSDLAWHQDIAHLLSGTGNSAYAWFDDEKLVISRSNCFLRPPNGFEATATFTRDFDDAHIAAYMEVEDDLLIAPIGCCCQLTVSESEDGSAVEIRDGRTDSKARSLPGGRSIHVWTYEKSVIEGMRPELLALLSPSIKKVLSAKGCQI